MERRALGRTGLEVSVLGFGCGAVGGLMVRGEAREQVRAVERALELGITYFDTAPSYGDGASETNLGRVLRELRPALVLGTKFHVPPAGIAAGIAASLEASLRRLGREQVDLLQMHNPVAASGEGTVRPLIVLDEVLPALDRLRAGGKFRFAGFTGVGDTAALQLVIDAGGFATVQTPYNLLNPSAGRAVLAGYPGQDYGGTLLRAQAAGLGSILIRTIAGGALTGSAERHPLGAAMPDPIGSGPAYGDDARRAQAFRQIAEEDPVALAIRFAISHPAASTAMVGLSSFEQLEFAAAAVERGPLPTAILQRIAALQDCFAAA